MPQKRHMKQEDVPPKKKFAAKLSKVQITAKPDSQTQHETQNEEELFSEETQIQDEDKLLINEETQEDGIFAEKNQENSPTEILTEPQQTSTPNMIKYQLFEVQKTPNVTLNPSQINVLVGENDGSHNILPMDNSYCSQEAWSECSFGKNVSTSIQVKI